MGLVGGNFIEKVSWREFDTSFVYCVVGKDARFSMVGYWTASYGSIFWRLDKRPFLDRMCSPRNGA